MSAFGDAAIDYARRGLAIIALEPRKKKPAFAHGLKDATTCVPDIKEWWDTYPTDNVGIVTGRVSGNLGVIDIDYDDDSGKDGYQFLRAWEKVHGNLPETWTVTTARGGQHLYYRFEGTVPPNTANEEIGIDFRGEGGYVMAPPSIHPNGTEVEWDFHPDDYDLAWADERVMEFLKAISPTNAVSRNGSFDLPETIMNGERDNVLFKYACSLQAQGYSDAEITVLVHDANSRRCQTPLSKRDVDMKIRQALKYEKGRPLDLAKVKTERSVTLAVTSKGAIKQTVDNCIEAVSNDPGLDGRFCYDTMSYTKMVRLPVPWRDGDGYSVIRDSDYAELTAYLERKYELYGKNKAIDAVLAVCERNKINPLTEWLDSLQWDGHDRISSMLTLCLGAEQSEYNVSVAHLMMQGAVRRAYEPGCKFDYMVVFVGKQGQGKSYFLSRLAMRPEWYLDNMNTFEGDASIEKLRGVWIAEVAELTAMKRQKDVETIKAFVTTRIDTIRPKYARETEQRPRTCIMVGTTNDKTFLTDKTGNRRYLCVDTLSVQPTLNMYSAEADSFFEQCWAQAVHVYKTQRPPLIMPASLMEDVQRSQEAHMEDDPRVGIIQQWLEERLLDSDYPSKLVCVGMICEQALGMRPDEYQGRRSVSNEIHRIMENEITGWHKESKKKKIGGHWGSQYCYAPDGYEEFLGKVGNLLGTETELLFDM